ncbi:Probable acetyltransferase AtfA [Mycobacteroides abscessus subsp. abscessus]|uniref:Probable acetyltransferase AtfA n=1 Tax=Mycobacteroides abscessus TaxID=36809 RepID=A0AB33T9T4_9MYCO|nr:acyltransferase [Mycobacteroides abscessus]MDO3081790.1 acyltransferase [Mycobacteroides abscessus subsp. abscessus]CPT30627.1 Probable acetyltransferase AtfA [Mycobacteroides abscessus]CPT31064.1 Probable acetyltransferase AtfA [Mycobacteroides abscessus]CPT32926.1 Probable acetyltransferase AtfA [Mycobacteroides abscessus]CPU95552.1 Probable acetyltransferase AtfA [Mycobacteroides abscessus]
MKLGSVFDSRNNALNACRLALATEVILFHSFPLTGRVVESKAILQLLFSVGVDGFFALSGFLITASWLRNPDVREYFVARALRILPGYYIVLAITAFVVAPLSVAIQGGSATRLLFSSAPVEYVLKNSALVQLQLDVGGTPHDIPYPGIWNASLWSLVFEVMCYIAVAGLGLLGLASRRWTAPVILILATIAAIMLPPLTFPGLWTIPQLAVRSAIMFSAGALLYQWRDRIPARWSLVAVGVVIVLFSGMLPDYRVLGALPLAYAVVVSGVLIKNKRMNIHTDLSYGVYIYASPTQQLLAVAGLYALNPFVFFGVSAVATLIPAAFSWFLIEKRALALKSRLKRKRATSAGTLGVEPAVADSVAPRERALSPHEDS